MGLGAYPSSDRQFLGMLGAAELIVAGVALQSGLFLQPSPPPPIIASLYSSIVIMALVTTVLTPLMLRFLIRRNHSG